METEWHRPFFQGFHRALCMLLWNLSSHFLCLHICSLTTFLRWPATSRFWAWGSYFVDFRLWNVGLDQYLFIYSTEIKAFLFFLPEWEVTLTKTCFDGYTFKYQAQGWTDVDIWVQVSKKFWKEIGSLCARDIYYNNSLLQGIHWLPLGQEELFFSFSLSTYKLPDRGIFVWLLLCSSNDQPTGNRPHV